MLAIFFATQTVTNSNDSAVTGSPANIASDTAQLSTVTAFANGAISATFNLNNNPPPAPTLGTYGSVSVGLSGQATVSPSAAPTDTTSLVATASSGFNGTLRANPTTGVVSVINANPTGIYTITVNSFGGGGMTTQTFQLTVQNGTACGTVPVFTSAANVTGVNTPLGTAVGDFNNDGKQDLVTANGSNATASIRLGNGAGGFSGTTTVTTPTNPNAVAVGDFNGDGNQDIAVSSSNNAVAIRLGDGAGGFTGTTNITTGQTTKSVALGDFNNDGKLDFVTADIGGDTATVALGNGAGGFPTVSAVSVGDGPGQVVVADFNSDGKLDFATSNQIFNAPTFGSPGTVTVRLGNGNGTFTNGPSYNVGDNPEYLAVGDFNEDGTPDLITSNQNSSSLSLILGDVSNTMTPPTPTTIPVSSGPGELRVADINRDGHQDLVFKRSGLENFAYVLSTGTGSFGTAVVVPVTGAAGTKLAVGDFNGDGYQDFVTANFSANTLFVQLGDCNVAPMITAEGPLTRQQGSAGSVDTIATVSDTETLKQNLTVSVVTPLPTGITVTSISAPNSVTGAVTATVTAACNAATGNNTVVLKVTDGNGTTATANLTVTVNAAAPVTTANAGGDQSFCNVTTVTLAANVPVVGTGAWTVVSGPSTSTAQFSNTSSANANFTPAGGVGTYTLRWAISSVCVTSLSDTVILTFSAPPTTANAGPDQNVCATSATLAANSATVGTGAWSIISGIGGTVTTPSSPTSAFTGVAGTTYTLRWTISNAPCTASTDDVVLNYNALPTITLGASPAVLPGATSANLPYTATTGSPNQYSIDYNAAANTAGFVDVTNATLPASPIGLTVPGAAAPGVYNATLTVRNSTTGCVSNSVAFTVTISNCPSLFTVNNTGDATDATPGNGVCETVTGNGICTLRAAIQEANALTSCSPLTINFSVTGTILLGSDLPTIAHPNLTITGPGANQLTVSGVSMYRPFNIGSGNYAVTISGLTVANGRGNGGGGLINLSTGQVNLNNMTFDSNAITASSGGGGIRHVSGGTLNVTGSTFLNNNSTGAGGGGINNFSSSGIVNVTNCTFSGNLANIGGGIHNQSTGTTNITNCTLVSNGGGINNNSGTVTVKNTIAVGNGTDINGTVTASNNLTVSLAAALLSALGNYGGTTQTFALLPGSPAINAGTSTGAPTNDQRGVTRDSNVDIGAFEPRGFALALNNGSPQSAIVNAAFANPLSVTVSSSFSEPVNGGQITFTPPGSGASANLAGNPATIINGMASSGTVTANALTGGPYNVSANTNGAAAAVNFALTNSCSTILVTSPAVTSAPLSAFFSQSFTQTGAVGTTSFTLNSGTLPNGLTLASNGLLSGTPTQTGDFPITVKVTDSNNCTGISATYTLHTNTAPTITPVTVSRTEGSSVVNSQIATVNDAEDAKILLAVKVNGATSATSGGITISNIQVSTTGIVTANVVAVCGAATSDFTLRVTDTQGSFTEKILTVSVTANTPPTLAYPVAVTVGSGQNLTINPTNGPSDNGTVTSIQIQNVSAGFTGSVTVGNDGIVQINNAGPLGNYTITVKATDDCGAVTTIEIPVTVLPFVVKISDPLFCTGESNLLAVHAEVTNSNPASATLDFNAAFDPQLIGVANTCQSSVGTCTISNNGVQVTGTLAANQTVLIDYKVKVLNGTAPGTTLCVNSTASLNGGNPASVQACTVLNCPPNPANIQVSAQKAGSVLVFPYYTSQAAQHKDTRLSFSNIGTQPTTVHLFFISGTSCEVADEFVCLTPNASYVVKASDADPETTGWLLAVAVNSDGVPIQNNSLIGNAFVLDGNYVDNYGAETFWAHSPVVALVQNNIATLMFDGSSYDAVASQFVTEIQSPLDAVEQRVITVGMQGDLNAGQITGAGQVGIGQLTNGNEKPSVSFNNFLTGKCQAIGTITSSSPRVPFGVNGVVPNGQVGSLKFNIDGGVGLLMTPRTALWKGIRALHKSVQTPAMLTIPVMRPTC